MTAYLRRTRLPEAGYGAVDRAIRALGLQGIRRSRGIRTTISAADGKRAGDLLNRDFTSPAPNRVWITDFTYCRTWAGFVYVAFIVDVFAQRIVAWHAASTKHTDLVMIPLRMALWQRDRDGHPVVAGQLICHADAGSLYTSLRFTEHLDLEGIAPSTESRDPYASGRELRALHTSGRLLLMPVVHLAHPAARALAWPRNPGLGGCHRRISMLGVTPPASPDFDIPAVDVS